MGATNSLLLKVGPYDHRDALHAPRFSARATERAISDPVCITGSLQMCHVIHPVIGSLRPSEPNGKALETPRLPARTTERSSPHPVRIADPFEMRHIDHPQPWDRWIELDLKTFQTP